MMNQRQKAAERLISSELKTAGHWHDIDKMLVTLCACVWVEMETLQRYINEKGSTYEVRGSTGDLLTKHRPEHQQLVEARGRLLTFIRELGMSPTARNRVQVEMDEMDEISALQNGT